MLVLVVVEVPERVDSVGEKGAEEEEGGVSSVLDGGRDNSDAMDSLLLIMGDAPLGALEDITNDPRLTNNGRWIFSDGSLSSLLMRSNWANFSAFKPVSPEMARAFRMMAARVATSASPVGCMLFWC